MGNSLDRAKMECYNLIKLYNKYHKSEQKIRVILNYGNYKRFEKFIYRLYDETGYFIGMKYHTCLSCWASIETDDDDYNYIIMNLCIIRIECLVNNSASLLCRPKFHRMLRPIVESPIFDKNVLRIIQKLIGPRIKMIKSVS